LTTDGALIRAIEPGRPAAQAGLRAGDIVLAVNGNNLSDSADLLGMTAQISPGRAADLLIWRAGCADHVMVKVGALVS
jgi:serine protease Do